MGPGILNFPCDTSTAGLWTTLGVKKFFSAFRLCVRKLNGYSGTFLILHIFYGKREKSSKIILLHIFAHMIYLY